MDNSDDKYVLHSTGTDKQSYTAAAGKFRVIIIIDSEPYQVEDSDFETLAQATAALMIIGREGSTAQIYDDQGDPQLKQTT